MNTLQCINTFLKINREMEGKKENLASSVGMLLGKNESGPHLGSKPQWIPSILKYKVKN